MNNGYTKIEIDGKSIGLKFGLPSLRMLLEKTVQFPNIWASSGMFNEAGYAYLLYYGYINNCMIKEIVPEYSFEFFMDFVESVAHDTELAKPLNDVLEVWAQSREVKRLNDVKEVKEEGEKKIMG